ncbi:N-acetylglucosamine-6-phosphate deacetylase [Microlunatus speluncae]|uniref:N-acetylglucosamine-6-phosphate deacetylase n=1 Tax=Microlunatus speluncae TaxID=2594267 RepID=UPI0012667C42|nr:N-acetylglucosamine-6-phosphate deacetylase [Microlunatus speluncae]
MSGSIALINGRVVLPDRVDDRLAVVCTGPTITALLPPDELDPALPTVDVGGRFVTPGLIDLHVHGGLGHSFGDGTEQAFTELLAHYARCGITAVQPTFGSAPLDQLTRGLDRLRSWVGSDRPGCRVIGAHLEGPYFSERQRGAHHPDHLRSPDDGSADRLLAYADVVSMISIAPELPGAIDLVGRIIDAGIIAAAGHSDGRDTDLRAAIDAGLSHVIHLWSGQSMTIREGPWRRPGMVEASLAATEITAEIIADNRHLPPTLMRLAHQCLGPRLCAVSDATSGAGLPDGTVFGPDRRRVVSDGVAMLTDGTSFAGSTTLINQMIPVLRDVVGLPLPEAVAMASTVPARIAGIDDHQGRIAVGLAADLAVFDPDFTAWRTMIAGSWVAD